MMKITRKFDYAMVLLTDLGLQRGTPLSARRISERYGLSFSLTANVLKGLQRNSIVRSVRGVHGGYVLGREPESISLGSIMTAVDGERRMTPCRAPSDKRESRCPTFRICPVRSYIGVLDRRIRAIFDEATLADVISTASEGARAGSAPRPGTARERPRGEAALEGRSA